MAIFETAVFETAFFETTVYGTSIFEMLIIDTVIIEIANFEMAIFNTAIFDIMVEWKVTVKGDFFRKLTVSTVFDSESKTTSDCTNSLFSKKITLNSYFSFYQYSKLLFEWIPSLWNFPRSSLTDENFEDCHF